MTVFLIFFGMFDLFLLFGICDDGFARGRRVCVYFYRITNEQLMLSALMPFQITKLTKSFIANIAFVRLLVRVNTHVDFQITR